MRIINEETAMESLNETPIYTLGDEVPTYLDIQAQTGITKHMGGYPATDTLYGFCHLEQAQQVLDMGCGIGIGPTYIAKRFGCYVTAVDISEKMLSWARQRAFREGVADHISFRKADVRHLPFEKDHFDAVIVESVLAFVEDKKAAIQELIRVTKPGGYIGLNETYWTQEPPGELLRYSHSVAPAIITEAEWRTIWEDSNLEECIIQTYQLDAKQEVRDRLKWIGWRSILPGWGRALKLLLTKPGWRKAVKEQFNTPPEIVKLLGYGLFVGRKPRKLVK